MEPAQAANPAQHSPGAWEKDASTLALAPPGLWDTLTGSGGTMKTAILPEPVGFEAPGVGDGPWSLTQEGRWK